MFFLSLLLVDPVVLDQNSLNVSVVIEGTFKFGFNIAGVFRKYVLSKVSDSAYPSSDIRVFEKKLLVIIFTIRYFGLLLHLLSECSLLSFLL